MDKFQKEFLDKIGSDEIIEISQLLEKAERFQLTVEVVYFALKAMQQNKNITPLLALQMAIEDWDI
jgi:hypothetical protein